MSNEPSSWSNFLAESIAEKKSAGRLRKRGGEFAGHSTSTVDFGSNDYLGLRQHPAILEALAEQDAFGSGASPVLGGHTSSHREVEERLADLCGFENALTFSSGYSCNIATLSSLAGRGDLILSDELNHASLIDGCRLSRAETHVYPHNDVDYLKSFLKD